MKRVFHSIILFAGRPIACEMGFFESFYSDNFVCEQDHCLLNWCFKSFYSENFICWQAYCM